MSSQVSEKLKNPLFRSYSLATLGSTWLPYRLPIAGFNTILVCLASGITISAVNQGQPPETPTAKLLTGTFAGLTTGLVWGTVCRAYRIGAPIAMFSSLLFPAGILYLQD